MMTAELAELEQAQVLLAQSRAQQLQKMADDNCTTEGLTNDIRSKHL